MDLPNFHPEDAQPTSVNKVAKDKFSIGMRATSQLILVLTLGLLPVLFWPGVLVSLSSSKLLTLLVGLFISVFIFGAYVLRSGTLTFRLSWPVIAIWGIALVSTVSAFLSGDVSDSLWGNVTEIHTVAFLWCLAIVMTATGILADSRRSLIRLYAILIATALLLSVWHFVRLVFGADWLSFGIFSSATANTLGGWNSLAVFYGLIILLSLLSLLQLSLSRAASFIVAAVAFAALVMLSIINFVTVWQLMAGVSGILLLYSLGTNLWSSNTKPTSSWVAFALTAVILVVSLLFIFFGSFLGEKISSVTNTSFLEVRPSFTATVDVAQSVYKDSALLGIGPNRFADAWRLHKDPSINQTIFWNTEFASGYSYLATNVVNTGLLGLAAWIFFLGTLLLYAWRFIFQARTADTFWHFIGLSSLVSALYLWLMTALYVPSSTILILAAMTTGVFLVAYSKLFSGKSFTISVAKNRVYGLVLIALTVSVISGGLMGIYTIGKQAYSIYTFNQAQTKSESIEQLETGTAEAFNMFSNDALARELALYQWSQMRDLLSTEEATTEEQQKFKRLAEQGINVSSMAISLDPTDPRNYQIQGNIYSILAIAGVEGAEERAVESYNKVREYDPKNPTPFLLMANMYATRDKTEEARSAAEAALQIRPTYTEAIFFLAQLDLNAGKTSEAIQKVAAVVQLEPQNPARRYQLGLLLSGDSRIDEAITAFEQAVVLDPQYANARYFLAIAYAEKGRTKEAIEQLTIVRDLNESNVIVNELIERLERGEDLSATTDEQVAEREPNEAGVTSEDLESDLVTSPNPVSE